MLEFIKQQRDAQLEGKIENREVKIFNILNNGTNIKKLLMDIDQDEAQRMKAKGLNEDRLEKAQGELSAMKFLAEREQNSKFQNKRHQALEQLVKAPHHTRSSIRVKFPDGLLLQGTFGAKETIEDVYKFVSEHLFYKPDQRQFYLYETPPRKVFDEKTYKLNLMKAKLVPSCMIYFAWKDLDQTKAEDGPFLDVNRLKDLIKTI